MQVVNPVLLTLMNRPVTTGNVSKNGLLHSAEIYILKTEVSAVTYHFFCKYK